MNRRDFVALLSLAVAVVGFVGYEMAGLLIPGMHTLSFYAHASPWLDYLLTALFLVGGIGGAVWFHFFHVRGRIPK